MINDFATACATYLAKHEGADFNETKANALENADDLWNYLWWLGTDESRSICKMYSGAI